MQADHLGILRNLGDSSFELWRWTTWIEIKKEISTQKHDFVTKSLKNSCQVEIEFANVFFFRSSKDISVSKNYNKKFKNSDLLWLNPHSLLSSWHFLWTFPLCRLRIFGRLRPKKGVELFFYFSLLRFQKFIVVFSHSLGFHHQNKKNRDTLSYKVMC